jgi:ribosomal protein L7Ae-like RNA K-turn-binding protein
MVSKVVTESKVTYATVCSNNVLGSQCRKNVVQGQVSIVATCSNNYIGSYC